MPLATITPETTKKNFYEVLPALRAIPDRDVKKPKVNIVAATAVVTGALEKLADFKEALARQFPSEKPIADELGTRSFAMMFAWIDSEAMPQNPADLPPLIVEGLALRERLLLAAEVMVADKKIDPEWLAEIRSGSGYLDVGSDLQKLATMLERDLQALDENSPKTRALLPDAQRVGAQIVVAFGMNTQPKSADPEVIQMRDRAYTYFLDAYEEARAQLAYLRRRQGDADLILPSIFTSKRGKTTEPPAPAPSPAAPTNGAIPPGPKPNDPDNPFVS